MTLSVEDIARRARAKRINERLKLLASTINAVGLTVLGAAVLVPLTTGGASRLSAVWIVVALVLHLASQALLGSLRSED